MTLYLIHAALATVAFLMGLGMFLGGVRRTQAIVVTGATWLVLLVATWNGWGPVAGVIAAGMSLLYMAVSLPLAGPAARSLFGVEPGDFVSGPPPPPEPLRNISEVLAAEGPESSAAEALVNWCLANPAVRTVLERHHASRERLHESLQRLLRMGAGRWAGEHYLAASVLAYAPALDLLLTTEPGEWEGAVARIAAHLEYGALL